MLTEDNIDIINNDIEMMKSMSSKSDTELFIMKLIRNRLFEMGINFSDAATVSSYSNFIIDFDLDNEEDVELVTKYINEFVDFSMRRSLSLSIKDKKDKPDSAIALECFKQILNKNQTRLL